MTGAEAASSNRNLPYIFSLHNPPTFTIMKIDSDANTVRNHIPYLR